ncbi:APC family permease [Sulfurimonas diazotrophicus]|uniref:APC family permease n=1 Tax=Sulfurimonas diazotrophicus TaxID=3131939 RepID=A0ABZ3H9U6_9BACT
MQTSRKSIGLVSAVAIGIGGMVGGGIFAVLGEAVSLSRGATPLAFLFGGIVALLTALSYARLSVAYPGRGGTVTYIDNAFGNTLASGSVNLMLWLSYLVTIALYAVAFAAYAHTFFPDGPPLLRHILISAAIVLPTAINLVSTTFVSRSESFIVGVKMLLLAVIIVSSLPYLQAAPFEPRHWGPLFSIVSAGMIIFVAYEGFELIANASEDIADPKRNLPRAFVLSVLIVIVLYVLIAAVTVSTVPEAVLEKAKDYALAVAAQPALGHGGFILVAVAALLATFSAINATIYGNARLGYTLAKDGRLPEAFDAERRNEPFIGILATMAAALLIANTFDLTEIAIIGSAGFLLIFALVNAAALKLAAATGGNRFLHLLALLLSACALVILLYHTWEENGRAVMIFGGFIALSVLFESVYGRRVRGHFLNRPY